eukprot:TRINITY_DN204_c0_g1_i1.p1 TRINITY_DN204_c0_g1~~TRINITY_DN204_c0_g1_i1.p1  ORF type:complete len:318 (-),score=99.15 TRINITY_DN204_c0_g1_i1:199-1152(-)
MRMGVKRFFQNKLRRNSSSTKLNSDSLDVYNDALGSASFSAYECDREMHEVDTQDLSCCLTIQDAEKSLEKNWLNLLAPYRLMNKIELEESLRQIKREIKVNCLVKGGNLLETENSLAFEDAKNISRSRMRATVENSSSLIKNDGTVRTDGTSRNVIICLLDGSIESMKAFEESVRLINNPRRDHLILVVPWNSKLPTELLGHTSIKRKSFLKSKDAITILQGALWRSAKRISETYHEILEKQFPNVDYTSLVPGVKDPKALTAILASKYTADWIVIGDLEGSRGRRRKGSVSQPFGSKAFVSELSKFTGTSKLMVV